MAPESNVAERQDLCEDRVRHQRSKSESHQDPESVQHAGSIFHEHRRGSHGPKNEADLNEDGGPGDRSYQHIHDKMAHSEPLNKQPELFSNSADILETTSNTSTSGTLSDNELLNLKAHFEQGQAAQATIKRELELERDAHSGTKAKLQSTTVTLEAVETKLKEKTRSNNALASLHKDAQQRVKERERHIQDLKSHHEQHYQSVVSAKDEDLRALQIELESATKQSEQSLRAVTTKVDAATQERDKAFKFSKVLQSQLAAAHKEKEELVLRIQGVQDANNREVESIRKDYTAYQRKANSSKSKLQQDLEEANEEQRTAKELYEAEKLVNKKLETRNKLLEKRLSEAKENVKTLQAELKMEQSQLNDQILELKTREQTIKSAKEKLQAEFDFQIVQHNDQTNDLLQQIRESHGLSQRYNFKVSDEEIIDEWQNVRHKIRQFVDKYTRPLQVPDPSLTGTWMGLSPLISRLLASPLHFPSAFEAYVWEWMSLNVFSPDSRVWAGDLGRSFTELSWRVEDQIRGPDDELISEYHGWRATSSNLLSRVDRRSSHNISYHASLVALVDDLSALLGPEFIREDAYRDLTDVIHHARAFEVMRRKVKSKIEVCFGACNDAGVTQRYNMPVDDSLMRTRTPRVKADLADSNPGQGSTVKLVVSPAIVRWGNSNGVDYDRKICLVKMDVLFSQIPNVVPQLPREPAPASGYEQLGHRINTVNEGRHSATSHTASGKQGPKIKKKLHTETGHSTPPHPSGQSAGRGQALSRASSTGQISQPRSAAQEGTKRRRASELEQRSQSDELSGGPNDYESPRDPKAAASKKRKFGNGGNRKR